VRRGGEAGFPRDGLEHPALLYTGREDLLGPMVPFVAAGVDNREFVFVAARADNLTALRTELGSRAGAVRWADTDRWHPYPGTRLRAFHELVTDALGAGATSVRLVGEPLWPPEPPELVREWQRYESAINAVLAPFPVTFVCLYDAASLDASAVDTAHRTHPSIYRNGAQETSGEFEAPERFLRRWNPGLPPPPPRAAQPPDLGDLAAVRRFLITQALVAGVRPSRAMDLGIAASEALTNAMVHGNGATAVYVWTDDGRFVCQIEDHGDGVADPLAGYRPPARGATTGRGLWLIRQLVDLFQIVPGSPGTSVRLHMRRG
jgi:anti-sigma regulatory factor (Ser/Thr protein kinase)